jgi:hypothetical protein
MDGHAGRAAMMSWDLPDDEQPSWLATIAFVLGAVVLALAFGAAVLTLLVWF